MVRTGESLAAQRGEAGREEAAGRGAVDPAGEVPELSAKGRRTRARLLAASRTVFERDGFLEARVADIATEAGVSHGTFYTYFESKTAVFRTVIGEVMQQVWHTRVGADDEPGLSAYGRIERANRQFVRVYREHGAMLGLQEQAISYDDEVRGLRMEVRRRSVQRVQRSIERMQAERLVREDVDARLAAAALVSMVSNFCYFWLVLGEHDYDDEVAIEMLSRLWASALRLDDPSAT